MDGGCLVDARHQPGNCNIGKGHLYKMTLPWEMTNKEQDDGRDENNGKVEIS